MGKKLYVGNIPYEVTGSQLEELFSKAGTVQSVNVITDNFSGRSKGFGFVEMSTDEEAAKGIEMYNGYEFSGRPIVVNEARPKPEFRSRDSGGYGGSGGYGDSGGYGGSGGDRRGGRGGGDSRGRRGGGGGDRRR